MGKLTQLNHVVSPAHKAEGQRVQLLFNRKDNIDRVFGGDR